MATNRNNNQNQYYQYGYNQSQYNDQYYAQQEQMQNEQYYAQQAQKQKEQAKKQAKTKRRNKAIALVATIGLAAGAIGGGVALWAKSKAEQTPGGSSTLVTNPNQTENPTPGTENPTPGTENPTPGTENPTPGTENPTPGTETQYTEAQYKTMAETKIANLVQEKYGTTISSVKTKGVDKNNGIIYVTYTDTNSNLGRFANLSIASIKGTTSYSDIYSKIKETTTSDLSFISSSQDLSTQVSATSYNTFVENVLENNLAVSSENCVVNATSPFSIAFYNYGTGVVKTVTLKIDAADMAAGIGIQNKVDVMNNLMESEKVDYTVTISSLAPSNTLGK